MSVGGLTVAELRRQLADHGIKPASTERKPDLVAKLKQALGEEVAVVAKRSSRRAARRCWP